MTAPTVNVTCTAHDQNGNPVAGALFVARLDRTEIYDGFVVPEQFTGVANADGVCVLQLWPNALGVASSQYKISAVNPDDGRRFLNSLATIPNNDCFLHEVMTLEPYPPINAAQQALVAAQNALAPVQEAAAEALGYRDDALNSANTAVAAASAASASADSAAASELAAQAAADAIDGFIADVAAPTGSALVGFQQPGGVARTVESKLRESVSVKDFGAVGDGVTDDTAAVAAAVAAINITGGTLYFSVGQYLIDAGTVDLNRDGVTLIGAGKGNNANLSPSAAAPTAIIIKGAGAGIRVRAHSITLKDFRLTSDTTRAATAFVITSPGVRVEPDDTATARADRCTVEDIRIDKQPGDGLLTVGSALYGNYKNIDIYECKGFGFRLEPGSLAGLTRTNTHYPGLSKIESCRVGYCGGHTVAASNNGVTQQNQMAIRLRLIDIDSFGNGQNTAIMYPSTDGNFYDFWVFGENCNIEQCAPCGRVGLALTPELIGGIWIAGRDHIIQNNRFIDTKQPIYWGYKAAQPSTGLTVDTFRIVNPTLTHTDCIKVESSAAKGLRVYFDRIESFTNVATRRIGSNFIDSEIHYQGTVQHISAITNTGESVILAQDTVHIIPISGTSAAVNVQGVLTLAGSSVSAGGGIFHVRLASSTPIATKWAGQVNTVSFPGGGALTGTSGNVSEVTVSCDNTNIYIENRLAGSITFTYQLSAFSRAYSIGV